MTDIQIMHIIDYVNRLIDYKFSGLNPSGNLEERKALRESVKKLTELMTDEEIINKINFDCP